MHQQFHCLILSLAAIGVLCVVIGNQLASNGQSDTSQPVQVDLFQAKASKKGAPMHMCAHRGKLHETDAVTDGWRSQFDAILSAGIQCVDLDVRAAESADGSPSGCLGEGLVIAHPSEDAASAESLATVLAHAQDAMMARADPQDSLPLVLTLEPKALSLRQTAQLWRAASATSAKGFVVVSPILNRLEDARIVAMTAQEEMTHGGCSYWDNPPPLTLALRDRLDAVDDDSIQLCRGILPQMPTLSGQLWALMPSLHWLRACSFPHGISAHSAIHTSDNAVPLSPNTKIIHQRAGNSAGRGVTGLIERADPPLRIFPWIIDSPAGAKEVQALLPAESGQYTYCVSNLAPQVLQSLQSQAGL